MSAEQKGTRLLKCDLQQWIGAHSYKTCSCLPETCLLQLWQVSQTAGDALIPLNLQLLKERPFQGAAFLHCLPPLSGLSIIYKMGFSAGAAWQQNGPWLRHPMLSELNICLEQDLIFLKISSLTVWPFLLPRKIKVSMQSQNTALDHLGCCDMVYKQGRGWEQSPGCPESTGLQWNQLKVINILPDFAGSFSASEMQSLLSQGTDSPCAQTSPPRAGSPSCQAASVCTTCTSEQNDWKAAIILLVLQ